jgi:XRE family aerobic/anaerobic benzoate catabolism transcriptional regulator
MHFASQDFFMTSSIEDGAGGPQKDPFLVALGERVRLLRARLGMTRRVLAQQADVSERHLANLETGQGNASVMLLRQLAAALNCTIAELVGEDPATSPEWSLIRQMLQGRNAATLQRVRELLAATLSGNAPDPDRHRRIALIGLRGAGKSTLGRMLADDLAVPFIELNRIVERLAGCDVREIHALYGAAAYRRYEQRALEETLAAQASAVIATGGGLVAEPATFNLLLARCYTVWLRAAPEDHMKRVIAQGDLRPMAGNAEAMADLIRILEGRQAYYAKADLTIDTAGQTLAESYRGLRAALPPASAPVAAHG